MSTTSKYPVLIFCPYLHLNGPVAAGPWVFTPIDQLSATWLSGDFESRCRLFLGAFRDATGKPIERPTVVVHRDRGLDGKPPTRRQVGALQLAIDFAVLDQNPLPSADNSGWYSGTSDNSEIQIWPIDVPGGRVTLSRGTMINLMSGGHRIDDSLLIGAPSELFVPWSLRPDSYTLSALYDVLLTPPKSPIWETAHRVRTAVGWLSKAWRNTPSIRAEDRIVLLKTGFEAITGSSGTGKCARQLRRLFERALHNVHPDEVDHLLWSPLEVEGNDWLGRKVTDLEHWFLSFGAARNEVIHEGTVPKLSYRRKGSNYQGSLIFTGERLLREVIRVAVSAVGYPELWRDRFYRDVMGVSSGEEPSER